MTVAGRECRFMWVFIFLLLVTSYVEAYDNTQWLGSISLGTWFLPPPSAASSSPLPSSSPRPSSSSSSAAAPADWDPPPRPRTDSATATTTTTVTPPSPNVFLPVTRYVLCTCVAAASFALGSGPGAPIRYINLACMLPVAFALQLISRTCCKFQVGSLVFACISSPPPTVPSHRSPTQMPS